VSRIPEFRVSFIIIFLKSGNELIQHKLLPVQQIRHLVYSLDKQYIFGVHMLHKKLIKITKRRVLLPHPLRIINKAVFPGCHIHIYKFRQQQKILRTEQILLHYFADRSIYIVTGSPLCPALTTIL
jgi:hypothetical protein